MAIFKSCCCHIFLINRKFIYILKARCVTHCSGLGRYPFQNVYHEHWLWIVRKTVLNHFRRKDKLDPDWKGLDQPAFNGYYKTLLKQFMLVMEPSDDPVISRCQRVRISPHCCH